METEELVPIAISKAAFETLKSAAAMRKRSIPQALDDLLAERAAMREAMFERAGQAMERMQAEAARNGLDKMTMDEIVEEIAQVRAERYSLANSAS